MFERWNRLVKQEQERQRKAKQEGRRWTKEQRQHDAPIKENGTDETPTR